MTEGGKVLETNKEGEEGDDEDCEYLDEYGNIKDDSTNGWCEKVKIRNLKKRGFRLARKRKSSGWRKRY